MRIAVIGATGMIGNHTARAAVERGHEVVVVHRRSSNLAALADVPFRSAVADLDDREALKAALAQVDAVVNCAAPYPLEPRPWQAETAASLARMENFYAACGPHLRKIVYVGGAIALRRDPDGKPGHEGLSHPERPRDPNPYLQAKWAMDAQALAKAKQGLPVLVGIPAMTFGEHDYGPTTGQLVVKVADGTLPGYVRGRRNVVYAGDAGRGLVMAVERGRVGERYLFTGTDATMDEIVASIADLADAPLPKVLPLGLARLVAKAQELRWRLGGPLPAVSATAIAVMSSGQFLSGAKARTELGYEPTLGLRETLSRALAWFRAKGYVKAGVAA